MFRLGKGSSSEGYSGSDSYRHVDGLIKGKGSFLRVITPYITADYARMLLNASKKKKVFLLVSNSPGNAESIKILGSRSRRFGLELVLWILMLGIAVMLLGLWILVPALFVIWVTTIIFTIKYGSSYPNMHLKVAKGQLVHEKLYLGDDRAIIGSANLTYSGMHRNMEHIEIISDSGKLRELLDHFDEIWAKY